MRPEIVIVLKPAEEILGAGSLEALLEFYFISSINIRFF